MWKTELATYRVDNVTMKYDAVNLTGSMYVGDLVTPFRTFEGITQKEAEELAQVTACWNRRLEEITLKHWSY